MLKIILFGIFVLSSGYLAEGRRIDNFEPQIFQEDQSGELAPVEEDLITPDNDYLVLVPASLLQALGFQVNELVAAMSLKEELPSNEDEEEVQITIGELLNEFISNQTKTSTSAPVEETLENVSSTTVKKILAESTEAAKIEEATESNRLLSNAPVEQTEEDATEAAVATEPPQEDKINQENLTRKFSSANSDSACVNALQKIKKIILGFERESNSNEQEYHIVSNRHRSALTEDELMQINQQRKNQNKQMNNIRLYVIPKEEGFEAEISSEDMSGESRMYV